MNSTHTTLPTDGATDLTLAAKPHVHVLRERNMRWYFGTQLISLTGLMLRTSLLSLLIISISGAKDAPPLVGAIWALNVLPGAFLGVFTGIFVDRTDKRRTLQITAILGAITAGILVYWTYIDVHHIAIWKIMTITFVTGCVNTVDGIGRNAILKEAILHPDNHGIGGIIFTSLYTFAMVTGNGLAGYLVSWIGYAGSFTLNALSYLVLIWGLSQMDFSHLPPKNQSGKIWTGMWTSAKEGARYSFSHSGIRLCILLSAAITIFGYCYNVLMPIIAKTMFAGGPKEYSYLAACSGMGSLTGAIVSIIWGERRPKTFLVVGCLVIGIGLIAFAETTNINHGAAILFCCGFGFMIGFLPVRGALMHLVPKERVGIVLGITFMFFYVAMAISAYGAGFIAKQVGCPTVLIMSGIGLIATAIVTPFLPGIRKIV